MSTPVDTASTAIEVQQDTAAGGAQEVIRGTFLKSKPALVTWAYR